MQCKIGCSLCKNCGRKMHDAPRRIIGASYFCKFPIPVSRGNGASSPAAVSFFRQEKYSGARDFRAFFSVCLPKTDPFLWNISLGRGLANKKDERRPSTYKERPFITPRNVNKRWKNEHSRYRKVLVCKQTTEVQRVCRNILGRKNTSLPPKIKKYFLAKIFFHNGRRESGKSLCENKLRV